MNEPTASLSKELKQWIYGLVVSALGSAFALFIFVLLASDGFDTAGASALSLTAIALTGSCPCILIFLLVARRQFLLFSTARRRFLLWSSALLPLPALILTLLSIFGIGHY